MHCIVYLLWLCSIMMVPLLHGFSPWHNTFCFNIALRQIQGLLPQACFLVIHWAKVVMFSVVLDMKYNIWGFEWHKDRLQSVGNNSTNNKWEEKIVTTSVCTPNTQTVIRENTTHTSWTHLRLMQLITWSQALYRKKLNHPPAYQWLSHY